MLDGEFNLLTFFKVAIAIGYDSGEMDENIGATIAGNETISLATIKPLDCTNNTF